MNTKAGRPKLSTFEKIKTLFWFGFVKHQVTLQLLGTCLSDIEKLNSSGISTPTRKQELKKLVTLKERLLGRSGGKKNGPLDTEIFNYTQNQAVDSKNELFSCLTDNKFDLPSEKSWNRFKIAEIKPENNLEQLDVIFPGSKLAYKNGPCSLFKIMSAPDLTEALDLFEIELINILSKKTDKEISSEHSGKLFESPTAIIKKIKRKDFSRQYNTDRYKFYNDIISSLQDDIGFKDVFPTFEKAIGGPKYIRNKFAHCDLFIHLSAGESACLYLSIAFISSRFLEDYSNLSRVSNDICALDVIEKHYAIPAKLWYQQNKENESYIIEEFLEIESLGYRDSSVEERSITCNY
jgi:hypothetical protein